MLSEEIYKSIDNSVLCWLATSTRSGIPNVSPKELFTYFEASIIIANIASPKSARNITNNPTACVSFIDIFTQKGLKISGPAKVLPATTPSLQSPIALLRKMAGGKFGIKSVFLVECDRIDQILAPSYQFFPETTERSQREAAYHTYKVVPVNKDLPHDS